jgi:hypothetical protein
MKRLPLKRCANGCDKPPKPPSLVICEDCLKGISEKMEQMIAKMERQDEGKEPI